jgi:HAE1 family hydrophobic/amphiphilic exporter-1
LNTVARLEQVLGPQVINHSGQLPSVTISFNLKPGVLLGEAVARVQTIADRVMPPAVTTTFQGAAQAFQTSFQNLWLFLLIAILVVYIVLGILYESYVHPLTILSGLPSAGFGALLTLTLFKVELNIYSFRLIRFRPIMMTTMAALLGAVPIALGYGTGGEARQPLGLAVVGGLLLSQLVTLYLTPVYYTYLAALQERFRRRKVLPLAPAAAD